MKTKAKKAKATKKPCGEVQFEVEYDKRKKSPQAVVATASEHSPGVVTWNYAPVIQEDKKPQEVPKRTPEDDMWDAIGREFKDRCWEAFNRARHQSVGLAHLQCAFCDEGLLNYQHVRAHALTCKKHPMREVEAKLAAALGEANLTAAIGRLLVKEKKARNPRRRK